ncbi:hypothetical protein HYH03_015229 [Edaphochlamys debaryana]|uniref:Chalcone-flavonone isomerase family protein n=1 Tax=Edaphochlamys debaryana TaxID=47281 RepID=A0A835XLN1_9CHLO|nr:hypothetical protein HYH03_015229 [Edaphochlamys debaryana]|eukprot:KAG2486136.1 hypothetical protein HYH03_015229 [Edaphochlamys debaryana]
MVSFGTRDGSSMPGRSPSPAPGAQAGLKPEQFRFWTACAAPAPPMASLSASILGGLGSAGTGANRKEPSTGYEFPPEWCYLKTKNCPSLAGLGVRNKRIVVKDIHVYALGIYADVGAAKGALAGFKKRSAEELEKDQAFYDAVVSSPLEKSLRLVISSRLVDRKKFLDALEERLAPKLKQAGEPATLDVFRSQFDSVHFEKGLEIAFTCLDNKKLVTQIGGKEMGTIASPSLCTSLFSIYLGSDPVSKDAKSTFGHSLAQAIRE